MEKIIFDKFNNTLSKGGECKKLGARDSLVLEYLLSSGDQLSLKNDIIGYAWQGLTVSDSSLAKSISILRNAFDELSPNTDIIVTVPRLGYKIKHSEIEIKMADENAASHEKHVSFLHAHKKNIAVLLYAFFHRLRHGYTTSVAKWSCVTISVFLLILSWMHVSQSLLYRKVYYKSPDFKIEQLSDGSRLLSNKTVHPVIRSTLKTIRCPCDFFVYEENEDIYVLLYLRDTRHAINIFTSQDNKDKLDVIIKDLISKDREGY